MSEELFLILHKVRGMPAFDIAQRIEIGDEEGWIIPTSGHRAYPYWHMDVDDIHEPGYDGGSHIGRIIPQMPPDWPDHYTCNRSNSSEPSIHSVSLIQMLDKHLPKMRRI